MHTTLRSANSTLWYAIVSLSPEVLTTIRQLKCQSLVPHDYPDSTANFTIHATAPSTCSSGQQVSYTQVFGNFTPALPVEPNYQSPTLEVDISIQLALSDATTKTISFPQYITNPYTQRTFNFPTDGSSGLSLGPLTLGGGKSVNYLTLDNVQYNVTYRANTMEPLFVLYYVSTFFRHASQSRLVRLTIEQNCTQSPPELTLAATVVN